MLLENKNAIITGGTRGIGYSIASKFLENGANVAISGSSLEKTQVVANELAAKFPNRKCIAIAPELSNPDSVKEAFESVKNAFGSIDILVNNAGMPAQGPTYDLSLETFRKVVELNLEAVFVCSKEVAFIMRDQGGGVILNTSSMVSKYGQPGGVAYPASKFAVNGLTLSMAREFAKDNIRVNGVAPGLINTEMMKGIPPEKTEPLIAAIPMGRLGEPDEIANAFLFLASDLASYITGVTLSVDGAAKS